MMLNAKLGMLLALVLLYGCSKSEPQKSTTPNDDPSQPAIEPEPVTEELPVTEPVTYQVTLSWTTPTEMEDGTVLHSQDIEAYYIQWGESENDLTNIIQLAKDANQFTIESLTQGDYYFSIQVEDQFGNRSELSNLVSKTFP